MKASSVVAFAAPVVAAMTSRAADATAECYPSDYAIADFVGYGEATNSTSRTISEVSFSYVDSDTGVEGTCELNSSSTNLTPGGQYATYQCDTPLLEFSWGKLYESENYMLSVTETVCNSTGTTTGSFVPSLSCKTCADGTELECSLAANSSTQSVKFSSWNPIAD